MDDNKDTKEKVQVYQKYLEVYLSIMGNIRTIQEVRIYEPFAGTGTDGSYAGSVDAAIKAIKNIKKGNPAYSQKEISYYINDKDPKKCEELKSKYSLDGENNFTNITTGTAKDFITHHLNVLSGNRSVATLWFLDPYGYTQVEKSDIEKIFVGKNFRDIIVFIPTRFITRFLSKESEPHTDKTPKPIKGFLVDWGFSLQDAKHLKDGHSFEELMVDNLQDEHTRSFFQSYTLSYNNHVNNFSLLFITAHILGAERFLQSTRRVYKEIRGGLFTDNNPWKITLEQVEDLIRVRPHNNVELYEWGIRHNLLAPELNRFLVELIDAGLLERRPCHAKTSKMKNHNYLGYKYINVPHHTQYFIKANKLL